MSNVITFPLDDDGERIPTQAESDRFKAIHVDHLAVDEIPESLGDFEDWLDSALWHLRVQYENGPGTIEVARSAISLILYKFEEMAVGRLGFKFGPSED